MTTARAEVRDLRADIAHWRRGRAQARLVDVLEDLYIALFAVLMFGAMLTNVVLNVARVSNDLCSSDACRSGRTALPWLVALGTIAAVAALARLFGPVFVTPATASWLLPTALDRPALLRPRLLRPITLALLAALLPAGVASGLAGFALVPLVVFTVVVALLAAAVVAVLATGQAHGASLHGTVWLPGLLLWAGLVLLTAGAAPAMTAPRRTGVAWWVGLTAAVVVAVLLAVVALRALPFARDRDVTAGSHLVPSLSGALATLDLALLYDVVLGHAARRRASVTPRRGAATGAGALVWSDLVRLRRSPERVVVLLLALAVPYAVAATGAGRVTLLVTALVAFLAGLPLLVALRVLTRTPSLMRMLPFPDAEARRLVLRVPGALLLGFGLLTIPALTHAVGGTPSGVLGVAVAAGASGLAAGVRWVTGRPPDYSRPLVSSPAGAVPTNLYGSVLRGFDVLLLTTAPLLLAPDGTGAALSLLLSVAVLGYLTGRA
jgi:hypothetical protein